MKEDFYQILGIPKDASQETIRRAYRKAVHRVHPDVSETPDVERLLKLQEAYETLSDPQKRKDYDRSLKQEPSRSQVDSWRNSWVETSTRSSPWIEVILSPWEAVNGLRIPLHIPLAVPCWRCRGTGWRGLLPCPECGGSGTEARNLTFFIRIPPGIQDGARLHIHLPNSAAEVQVLVRVRHP